MEGFPCEEWLNVSCLIPYSAVSFSQINENLQKIYPQLLKDFPQFRLKIVKIKDYPHWQYAENSEIKYEEMISIQDNDDDTIPYRRWTLGFSVFGFIYEYRYKSENF